MAVFALPKHFFIKMLKFFFKSGPRILLAVVGPLKSGTAIPPQAREVSSLSYEISFICSRVKFKLFFSFSACGPQQQNKRVIEYECFVKPQSRCKPKEPHHPVLKYLSSLLLSHSCFFTAHVTLSLQKQGIPKSFLHLLGVQGYFLVCSGLPGGEPSSGVKPFPARHSLFISHTDSSLQTGSLNQCFSFTTIIHNNLQELLPTSVVFILAANVICY